MSDNPIKAWLKKNNAVREVLQSRVDEVIELKRRQERVNNMLIDELIGFPVPQEHRKELNDKLNTYENCDRTTLISLLLQYDWELLQTRKYIQGKLTMEAFRTRVTAEEMKVAAQKFHDAVEKMNDTFKEKVSCRFCKFYENNCPLSVGYAEKNNGLLFCYPNRICDDFEFREEL